MSCDCCEIQKLLHSYSKHIDEGNFKQFSELFTHARLILAMPGGREDVVFEQDAEAVETFFRENTMVYKDGSMRTRHNSSNAIINIDESGTRATCESYMTVFQTSRFFPLQPIATALDNDVFEKVDGKWQFAERRASAGIMGNMSRHVRLNLPLPRPLTLLVFRVIQMFMKKY